LRSSGKIHFLQFRDGSGFIQAVAVKAEVSDETFDLCKILTQESSIEITGSVRRDERAPTGYELTIKDIKLINLSNVDYPITHKEHGIEFLMDMAPLAQKSSSTCNYRIRARLVKL
jgi:asparaginyl-tRNA synthetase